ncbi:preprotein translocase subunit SecG [Gammaproteobacteria bacterium]|nr:preprotein translocase subunit SecG [Gammaproteobacteria bacterium]
MQMNLMIALHFGACLLIIALVLMQHGKGADAGAAFGSGGSGTVFGAAGTGNFLSKLTRWVVIIFFGTSLSFMFIIGRPEKGTSVLDTIQSSGVPSLNIPALPIDNAASGVPKLSLAPVDETANEIVNETNAAKDVPEAAPESGLEATESKPE